MVYADKALGFLIAAIIRLEVIANRSLKLTLIHNFMSRIMTLCLVSISCTCTETHNKWLLGGNDL